jgi:predicted outer membrane repeat protein
VVANGDFSGNGGAIFTESGTISINGSTFSNNKNIPSSLLIGGNGGAIFNYSADCYISNCNFNENIMDAGMGGAIYNEIGIINIENCSFKKNTTSGSGGAIHNNSLGSCLLLNSEFIENSTSNDRGGAIFNLGKIKISKSYFNKNFCNGITPSGGAVYSSGIDDSIVACTFENNTSYAIGGAVFVNQNAALINSTFTHNLAKKYSGGAVYSVGVVTISHCTFFGNVATFSGGAIYSYSGATMFIDNSIIAGDSIVNNEVYLREYEDVYGVINSEYGHNIFGNTSGLTLSGVTTGNFYNIPAEKIINVNLENNGGSNTTHALINCSIAINAGESTPFDMQEDQRGQSYLDNPDIGAYESDGSTLSSPKKPTVVLPPSYCSTELINELEAIGTNIKWYSSYPQTLVNSGDKFSPALVTGDTLFYVTQTDDNGCESHPALVPLVIDQAAPLTLNQESATICPGSSTSFTISGSATREVIHFDGEGDFVEVGVVNSSIPTLNESYTIEAWIFANSMKTQGIIGWGNYENNNQINSLKLHENGILNDWGGNSLSANTGNIKNAWHHIAATYDGTTRKLYLDGGFIGSDVPGILHEVPSSQLLQIGSANYSEVFSGDITEIRIWNTARSTEEIQSNMNHKIDPSTPNLISYWRGHISDHRILDATGNSNDGYLIGDAFSSKINLQSDYLWTPATGLDAISGTTINASPLITTVYTVTATSDKWVCSSSKEVTVNTDGICNGTKESLSRSIEFNPNPSEGNVTLKLDESLMGNYHCTVKDVAGKIVFTTEIELISGQNNHQLNLSGLSSGIYFVSINNETNSSIGKLVIK